MGLKEKDFFISVFFFNFPSRVEFKPVVDGFFLQIEWCCVYFMEKTKTYCVRIARNINVSWLSYMYLLDYIKSV